MRGTKLRYPVGKGVTRCSAFVRVEGNEVSRLHWERVSLESFIRRATCRGICRDTAVQELSARALSFGISINGSLRNKVKKVLFPAKLLRSLLKAGPESRP